MNFSIIAAYCLSSSGLMLLQTISVPINKTINLSLFECTSSFNGQISNCYLSLVIFLYLHIILKSILFRIYNYFLWNG